MYNNKIIYTKIFITFFIFILYNACQKKENKQSLIDTVPYELTIPKGFPNIKVPENNPLTVASVELGKELFFDPILSLDLSVACASCHFQHKAFSDSVAISQGLENRLGFRNAPTLANVAYHTSFFKDGGVLSLDNQALTPLRDENEMGFANLVDLENRLEKSEKYQLLAQKAYGRSPDIFVITRALANFQRILISGNSRFDAYFYQGEISALNEVEKAGMNLFFSEKTNCSKCHSGFNFSHNSFFNNGLYQEYEDLGRKRVTIKEEDEGKFKVPTLRNIALTAPYMHNGSLSDLESVLNHYNKGGSHHFNQSPLVKPLDLTDEEKAQIIAFLRTLTDSTFINNKDFKIN